MAYSYLKKIKPVQILAFNINLETVQHKALNAINNYYLKYIPDNRPAFHDIAETCPELLAFDTNYETIKEELESIISRPDKIPKYAEIDEVQAYISGEIYNDTIKENEAWKVFMLYLMGQTLNENQSLCRKTSKILNSIPNLFQAFFSVLEGGKSILSHKGPYLGYLRYHIGMIVPKNDPPTLLVDGIPYTWSEGNSVMFDDTLEHEVINNCSERRVILIVDILRPLPLVPHCINWLITRLIIKNIYARKLLKNLNKFKNQSMAMKTIAR